MLLSLIIGIGAAVVAILVIVAVFAMRSRADSKVSHRKNHSFTAIDTVGVKSSVPDSPGATPSAVSGSQGGTGSPADNLSSRFTAIGAFAAFVFGILGIKAFKMQILDNQQFETQAKNNQYTTILTPAPRGGIYDQGGVQLVTNRSSLTILADSDVADDHDVVARLSALLGVPYNIVRRRILDASGGAQAQRVVASDARRRDIAFIAEHSDAFKGVSVQTRTVRHYPYGALAAHALGYAGAASESDLEIVSEGRNIQSGDDVGKSGVEAAYDSLLAGEHGQRKVIADANGNVREVVSEVQPTKGSDVYLNIIAPVQYLADQLLKDAIAPVDNTIGTGKGVAGAAVVMDITTGGIVAMASYPTYSPENFVGGISQDVWELYNTKESYYPLLNRVIAGAYPAASTYKSFTSLAGLKYGFADEKKEWDCGGSWDGFNSGDIQNCWNLSGHGPLDLRGGIVNSCDVVFYEIAKDFFYAGKTQGGTISDTAMQEEIAKFNFGKATGIDIEGEVVGRIPTPEWKKEAFRDQPEEAQWRGGDMTNMVIGQGYVLITPIQLAVAYGAIASGNLMKPRLIKEVRNSQGKSVVTFEPEVVGKPDIDPKYMAYVRDALHGVANENPGVSKYFAELGIDAAGKTGTAEVAGEKDTAWFACYGPYEKPKYVCACVVQQGGDSGAATPIGAELLAACLQYDAGELTEVGSVIASSGKYSEGESSSSGGARTD